MGEARVAQGAQREDHKGEACRGRYKGVAVGVGGVDKLDVELASFAG